MEENQNFEKTAEFLKECFDLLSAGADIGSWKDKIKGKIDEYSPRHFFFYPVDIKHISSITVSNEFGNCINLITIGFESQDGNYTLWPLIKEYFKLDFKIWPEVVSFFCMTAETSLDNKKFIVTIDFDRDPDKSQIFHIISMNFERIK